MGNTPHGLDSAFEFLNKQLTQFACEALVMFSYGTHRGEKTFDVRIRWERPSVVLVKCQPMPVDILFRNTPLLDGEYMDIQYKVKIPEVRGQRELVEPKICLTLEGVDIGGKITLQDDSWIHGNLHDFFPKTSDVAKEYQRRRLYEIASKDLSSAERRIAEYKAVSPFVLD